MGGRVSSCRVFNTRDGMIWNNAHNGAVSLFVSICSAQNNDRYDILIKWHSIRRLRKGMLETSCVRVYGWHVLHRRFLDYGSVALTTQNDKWSVILLGAGNPLPEQGTLSPLEEPRPLRCENKICQLFENLHTTPAFKTRHNVEAWSKPAYVYVCMYIVHVTCRAKK